MKQVEAPSGAGADERVSRSEDDKKERNPGVVVLSGYRSKVLSLVTIFSSELTIRFIHGGIIVTRQVIKTALINCSLF